MSYSQTATAEPYRSLVEHAPYGIFRSTRRGRILLANSTLVELLGYATESEVLGLDLDEDVYVDPTDRERVIAEQDEGRYSDLESRWMRADGTEIVVRLSGRSVYGDEEGFLFFETFVEDVTEQRRTEARLDRVLESVGAGLFILSLDPDGAAPFRATWVSESVAEMHGYPLDETVGPGWFEEGLHPEDRERTLAETHAVLERGHVIQEFRFRHRDGSYRWFRQDLRLVEDAHGNRTEVVGVWMDVTDQKQAEVALQESRERLDRVLDAAGAFVFVLVPDGSRFRFAWLSEGVRTLLGYTRREALQPGWFPTCLHPEDRDRVVGSEPPVDRDDSTIHEFRFRHRNGGYRWFREELRVLDDGPDGPESLVGVAVDITNRKEAELAVQEGGERLRSIMNAVPDAVMTIDGEGRIVDLNPAVEEVYGYRGEELIGRPFTLLFPSRFREENSRSFQRLISDRGEDSFMARRMRGLHRSGKEFSAELSVAQHTWDGAPYVTAVFRDVTERRRMEEERKALIEDLQTALREVRTLRGILPVCSSCKKIRDEESGSWERIETYLKEHSEAQLSHGICPDCAQELYGADFWDEEG